MKKSLKIIITLAVVTLLFQTTAIQASNTPVSGNFETGSFVPGSSNGCFLQTRTGWQPITAASIPCSIEAIIKTDENGWGTILYSFGDITLRPNSETQFVPGGIILTSGTFRAFVHRSPKGFQFKTAHATMGVRGTVFTVGASDSVSVEAGSVEVTPNNGQAELLTAGQNIGNTSVASLPEVLGLIETALRAEHDKKPLEAAAAYAKAISDKTLTSEYRDKLLQQCLKNLITSGVGPDNPTVKLAADALKASPETWYKVTESLLSQGNSSNLKNLSRLSDALHVFNPNDTRDLITSSLLADAVQDKMNLAETAKKLAGTSVDVGSSASRLKGFWSDSLIYVKTLATPQAIKPGEGTRLISPAALAGLSPAVAKKRIQTVGSLPRDLLEAQGLYYLIRAFLLDGRYKEALDVMHYMESHYANSSWLSKARAEIAQYNLRNANAKARLIENASRTRRIQTGQNPLPGGNVDGVFVRPAAHLGTPGHEATGRVASSSKNVSGNTESHEPANSFQDGY
ncbi:MAG: FecR domain-containing protein [Candidatus Riflebacteria bacterium]|nr:FecR domain-containing protein [Candidatus Riflebacteria bacterium]